MKKYLIVILLLASCSTIPTSGPINPGIDVSSYETRSLSKLIPQPPQLGMSQAEIVAGFLAANSSVVGDFSIAREYLVDFIAPEWVPTASIQVFQSELALEQTGIDTITATGIPRMDLDDQLRPKLIAGNDERSFSFFLIEENGEWRITNPPSGIIVLSAEFQRNFEISEIWFVDRTLSRLVPDFIAISRINDPATQLIRALTNGSSNWLKPAVVNLIGADFAGEFVGVERIEDKVIVDLEAEALRLTDREQQLLIGQLAQTLFPLKDINALEVTVGGQTLTLPGQANPVDLKSDFWFGNRTEQVTNIYAINSVGRLTQPDTELSVRSWLNQLPNSTSLTVAGDEQDIAVAIPERAEIAVGDRGETPITIERVSLVSNLNFDVTGKLWFLNRNSRLWFCFDGSQLQEVNVPLPANSTLNHVMLAPDNIRAAIISESATTSTLSIARLVNSDRSLSLKDDRSILTLTGEVRNLSWYSATKVVLLVQFPNQGQPVAVIVDLATAAQTIIRLPVNTQQLDANGYGTIMVIDQVNRIWQRSTGAWEQIGTGQVATYPRR
jgi:hypothetical protein